MTRFDPKQVRTFLSFRFLICKMGRQWNSPSRLVRRIQSDIERRVRRAAPGEQQGPENDPCELGTVMEAARLETREGAWGLPIPDRGIRSWDVRKVAENGRP